LRDYIEFGFLKIDDRGANVIDKGAHCIATRPLIQAAKVPAQDDHVIH
jgi:hypothetical protein